MQYFTGSKEHNITLRSRALKMGLTLNEYGLARLDDNAVVAGETEEEIYAALGLAWIPPELRENQGEIDAASEGRLPVLVEQADIRGDLHMHTTESDGRATLEEMAASARQLGYEYIAITDHSKALAMANGLDEARALAQARAIRDLNGRLDGFTLLAGVECDIRADGTMDLADDCLAELDIVIASIHSGFALDPFAMTDRLLAAIANPWVDVLGHLTGRRLLQREPLQFDVAAVLAAAAEAGVAIEINCQVERLDVGDTLARAARDRGIPLVISTDAHSAAAFPRLNLGIGVARRAWLTPDDVLNTRPLPDLLPRLRRRRSEKRAS
jgi:DNA polymerase (family 10)